MKVDYLEKQLLLIGFLAQDSLSGVAALVKEVFTRTRVCGEPLVGSRRSKRRIFQGYEDYMLPGCVTLNQLSIRSCANRRMWSSASEPVVKLRRLENSE